LKPVMDGTLEHVHHLAVRIGCRPIGSAANLAAAEYICGVFEQAGLALETQQFTCPSWTEEYTRLELGGQPLEAFANAFSAACDVTAETIPVGTLRELESAALAGGILVLYGDLAQNELAPSGAIYVSDRDRKIIRLLEDGKPAAIIAINPTLHERWRLIEDFDLNIPSATVTAYSGLRLLREAGSRARLRIAAHRSPSHSANIIGRLEGERPERIVLCAHYDTKVDTPGAYDNAAGVAVIMTLARLLSRGKHRHTLEWVAFSGEETYGLGDMEYARRMGSGFDSLTAAINFDGVGPYTGTTTAACFAASQTMEALLDRVLENHPSAIKVEPWPASDHYIFYSNGTPSIAFGSRGIRDLYHTASDTFEWISGQRLAEVLEMAIQLVESLDEQDPKWARPDDQP